MSNLTPHYNLKKPEQTDYYDVDDFNGNADKIDTALYSKIDKTEKTTTGEANKVFTFSDVTNTIKHIFKIMKSSVNAFRVANDSDTEVFNVDTVSGEITGSSISMLEVARKLVKRDSNGKIAGLENVTNTSDANKPVSTAQQTALDLKFNVSDMVTTQTADKGVKRDSEGLITGVRNLIYVKACARTSTIPNTLAAIDSYIPVPGDLILFASFTGGANDGIYEVKASGTTWTRASIYSNETQIMTSKIRVLNGTNYKNTIFQCINEGTITIGLSIIKIVQEFKNVLEFEPYNVRTTALQKRKTILTQYGSSNPDFASIIGGTQHFLMQITDKSEDTSDSGNGIQIAWNPNNVSPRMAIRGYNSSGYSSWKEVITEEKAFGIGQTWQNVTASRAQGQTYTNTTGKPIMLSIYWSQTGTNSVNLHIDGSWFLTEQMSNVSGGGQFSIIIPSGSTYRVDSTNSIVKWFELR